MVSVITLETEEEGKQTVAFADAAFKARGIDVSTSTAWQPAEVGTLAGFIAIASAAAPVAGTALVSALVGASVKELIDWLKGTGKEKKARISQAEAESLVLYDLESVQGVAAYRRLRSRMFPGCDQTLTTAKNCFSFQFEDTKSGQKHAYVVTNNGEISSYQVS